MTLTALNEALRRDLKGFLHNKELISVEGTDIIVQLTNHLGDDRDNGVARGDLVKPKDLQSALRVGTKKLLKQYDLDELCTNKKFEINFKLKAKKTITDRDGRKKKHALYASIIVAFDRMRFVKDKVKLTVITVTPPFGRRADKNPRASARVII